MVSKACTECTCTCMPHTTWTSGWLLQHLVKTQTTGSPISPTMLPKPTKEVQLHVGINIQTLLIKQRHNIYPYLSMEYRAVWRNSSNPSAVSWYKSWTKFAWHVTSYIYLAITLCVPLFGSYLPKMDVICDQLLIVLHRCTATWSHV